MGVEVVVSDTGDCSFAAVADLFARWEKVFSRFRPESELNRVNAARFWLVPISPLFSGALEAALGAAAATDGLVDPTLGAAIEAAGYDRDFAALADSDLPAGFTEAADWRAIRVLGRLLLRPPGTILDLNGVVKALAVDEALRLLSGEGFVAAGGDIATRGATTVGLPRGESVRLLEGGLATSGRTSRRWLRAGRPQHHLIDPRTGRPSSSRWLEVTVAAESCLAADVAAKAAFLHGDHGPGWLDERGLPGRFVAPNEVVVNAVWSESIP
jgi:thiamine biosynthesis lipoprotein